MRRFLLMIATLACAVVVVGCTGRGTLSADTISETGAYKVTATDAAKDSSVGTLGGGFEIGEGQLLMVSPDLTEGSLKVRILDEHNKVAFDEEVEGRVLFTRELAPGDYSVGVTCTKDGATGSLLLVGIDADEYEQQNEALEEKLESGQESTNQ